MSKKGKVIKNAQENLEKHILRAFRKELNEQFKLVHKNKHYNWSDEKYRSEIKKFFTCKILMRANGGKERGYNFSEEFYTKYELTFFTLIYNTKKVNEKEELGLYHTQTKH